MQTNDYLKLLVEQIHSCTVATIGADGHPQTRVIDMMLWDNEGVYFLTAKGKSFYQQLITQQYLSLSATKEGQAVSLRGKIKSIGHAKLDEIFIKNPYMQKIYPVGTRSALEVFWIYEAQGEYFDISDPAHVVRDSFVIGTGENQQTGYFVGQGCTGCQRCSTVCPQNCIVVAEKSAHIAQNHCLHCGRCAEVCPVQCIERNL